MTPTDEQLAEWDRKLDAWHADERSRWPRADVDVIAHIAALLLAEVRRLRAAPVGYTQAIVFEPNLRAIGTSAQVAEAERAVYEAAERAVYEAAERAVCEAAERWASSGMESDYQEVLRLSRVLRRAREEASR